LTDNNNEYASWVFRFDNRRQSHLAISKSEAMLLNRLQTQILQVGKNTKYTSSKVRNVTGFT